MLVRLQPQDFLLDIRGTEARYHSGATLSKNLLFKLTGESAGELLVSGQHNTDALHQGRESTTKFS